MKTTKIASKGSNMFWLQYKKGYRVPKIVTKASQIFEGYQI